jgi:hypothetical protein
MILMSKEALQVILRKNNEMENFLIATTFLWIVEDTNLVEGL